MNNDNWEFSYSTNKSFKLNEDNEEFIKTIRPSEQALKIYTDNKNRKGKIVTIVSNFIGPDTEIKALSKTIKNHFGVGGTIKNKEIIIQGNLKEKIKLYLIKQGYSKIK